MGAFCARRRHLLTKLKPRLLVVSFRMLCSFQLPASSDCEELEFMYLLIAFLS